MQLTFVKAPVLAAKGKKPKKGIVPFTPKITDQLVSAILAAYNKLDVEEEPVTNLQDMDFGYGLRALKTDSVTALLKQVQREVRQHIDDSEFFKDVTSVNITETYWDGGIYMMILEVDADQSYEVVAAFDFESPKPQVDFEV